MARGHPRSGVASPTSPAPAGCSAWSSGCDRQAAHSCSSMKKVSLLMAASHRDPHEMPRLKASLRLNDLATDKQLEQFDVHYRFLSAFVHPLAEVTALLYGRNRPWPAYDHYASELVLLYLNLLAARELTHFAQMASQAPSVEVAGWSETQRRCELADRLCSHLWFPGQGPHAYDRWRTANQRAFEILGHPSRREEVTRPEDLNDTEVRYYRNPLQRLVEMHMSPIEMVTGFAYQSRGNEMMPSFAEGAGSLKP